MEPAAFILPIAVAVAAPLVWWWWHRKSVRFARPPVVDPSRALLRVASYNILGDGPRLALSSKHTSYCALEELQWSYRGPLLIEQIKEFDVGVLCLWFAPVCVSTGVAGQADIISLQETQYTTMVSTFWRHFQETYTVIHSTPYKNAEFATEITKASLLRSLEGFCRGLGIPAESKLYDSLYSRMDGCEVIIVRDVRTGRIACVTNVHLYWNPRFPDVKVLQGLHTLQCIENLITEYLTECSDLKLSLDTLPVIITGDFNSLAVKRTPDAFDSVKEFPEGGLVSGVYTLFTTGSLSPSHPEHPAMRGSRFVSTLTSPFPPFKSAYKKCTGADPVFTTKVSDFEGTLDFIFVSSSVGVVDVLPMPYEDPKSGGPEKYGPIPNRHQPSDHLPLVCDVTF